MSSKKHTGLGGGIDQLFGELSEPQTPTQPKTISPKPVSLRLYPADKKLIAQLQAHARLQDTPMTVADVIHQALALLKVDMGIDD